jgi:hypothetical protein
MKPSLHSIEPPRYQPEPRDWHFAHGLRAALALAVVLAVLGTLVLIVATQEVADPTSSLLTLPGPAEPAPLPGA